MTEKIYNTRCGDIHYWINMEQGEENPTLIFLPGLTADHRLFEKQIEYFEGKNNIFVWDAPAHGKSWPFSFDFSKSLRSFPLALLSISNSHVPFKLTQFFLSN